MRAGICQPPSNPTRAIADSGNGNAAGHSRNTGDQASSDSDSSREDVTDPNMDTASSDCITCLDTDKVTIQTAQKKYWKRVWASWRFTKCSLWTEAQLKRISKSLQAVWGYKHESVQMEWNCTLADGHNSFEMCRMTVRTDQLFCIAVAINSQIYTRDVEAKAHGLVKTLVFFTEKKPCPLLTFLWKGID